MWLLACAAVAARAAPTCPPGALEGGSCAELADEALEEVRRSPQAAEWDAEDAEDEEWSEEDFEEVGTDDWEAARDERVLRTLGVGALRGRVAACGLRCEGCVEKAEWFARALEAARLAREGRCARSA